MLHRVLDRQRYDRAPDHDRCGAASSSIFDFRFSIFHFRLRPSTVEGRLWTVDQGGSSVHQVPIGRLRVI